MYYQPLKQNKTKNLSFFKIYYSFLEISPVLNIKNYHKFTTKLYFFSEMLSGTQVKTKVKFGLIL